MSTFLRELDVQNLVLAFPRLLWLQPLHRLRHLKSLTSSAAHATLSTTRVLSYRPWIGREEARMGTSCWIEFGHAQFFRENVDGCCRAAAVLAFAALGHPQGSQVVTAAFDPMSQTVRGVGMNELMTAAFFNRPCYVSVFALDGVQKQFVGKDFARNLHAHIRLDNDYDDDDEEGEDEDDDSTLPPTRLPTVDGFHEATAPYLPFPGNRRVVHPTAADKRDVATFIDTRTTFEPCMCELGDNSGSPFHTRLINNLVVDFSRNELEVFDDEAGANPNVLTSGACYKNRPDTLEMLLDAGASIQNTKGTLLHLAAAIAVSDTDLRTIELLLRRAPELVTRHDAKGQTPLDMVLESPFQGCANRKVKELLMAAELSLTTGEPVL
ncbi:hypothetical protein HDU96_009643 [Phlyctochytrium bullatum]|nr:hypothetical protein HDU96_009643 [Phlyctochytrium bullatum]